MFFTNRRFPIRNTLAAGLAAFISIASSTPSFARSTAASLQPASQQAKIQIAILLDTSSSMSGLINQTRDQLWNVVNEFTQSTKNGVTPSMEVAVYEYGNSNLAQEDGYTRNINPLTSELDQVSEALFSLTTNGGDEYCGYVIDDAVKNLNWSQSADDIKVIFIAGNEEFTQGPVSYRNAIENAKSKGIIVNTIHAGDYATGANSGWSDGALLAGGNYTSIDKNHVVAHVVAPQDKKIAELNQKLNDTYVPFGKEGSEKADRQRTQDEKNSSISLGLLVSRVKTKVSSLYNNYQWDLVDAFKTGEVTESSIEAIETEALPVVMQDMDTQQKIDFVRANSKQREEIQADILALSEKRDEYVAEQKKNVAKAEAPTIEESIVSSVREIGASKGFNFK